MTQFDATARISMNVSAFSRAAQTATRATTAWNKANRDLQASLTQVEARTRRIGAATNSTLAAYRKLVTSLNSYQRNLDKTATSTTALSTASRGLRTTVTGLTNASNAHRTAVTQENAALRSTGTLYSRLVTRAQAYSNALHGQGTALNNATAQQARLNAALGATASASRRYGAATNSSTVANIGMNTSLLSLHSALTESEQVYRNISAAMFAFSQQAVSTAITYEAAFAQVNRVTQETSAQMEDLREDFRGLAREVPIAFDEISQIATRAAQVGIARTEILKFTEVVAMFARTTEVADEQATLLLGRILQMGRVPPNEIENLASAISELGSSSAATDFEVLKITESIAAVATQTGLSTESLLGFSGALAGLGVRAELSRGALTRVFNSITKTIGSTDEKTQALSKSMGLNQSQMEELVRTDADQFYLRFFEGLSKADAAGQNLNTTLRAMGIINSRDINVVTRLASNYDLLSEQVSLANDAFERGDFLRNESARIFDTVQAKLVKFSNAWKNFLDTSGRPLLVAVAAIVDFGAAMLDMVQAIPGSSVFLPIIAGVTALVGAFFAYRVAVTAVTAAALAYRQINTQLTGQSVGLRTAVDLLSGAQMRNAAATGQAAAATGAYAAAAGRATAATSAATGAVIAQRGALAATAGFLTGPWGLAIGAAIVGGLTLATVLSQHRSESEKLKDAAFEAVGGVEAFTAALRTDTEAGTENERVYRRYVTTKDDVFDADIKAAEAVNADREARIKQIELLNQSRFTLESLAQSQGAAGQAARKHLEEIAGLEEQIDDTNAALSRQEQLLGDQSAAMIVAATEAVLMESKLADLKNATDLAAVAGVNFGAILDQFLTDPAGAADELSAAIGRVDAQIDELGRPREGGILDPNLGAIGFGGPEGGADALRGFNALRDALLAIQSSYGELDSAAITNTRVIENNRSLLASSGAAYDVYAGDVEEAGEATGEFGEAVSDQQEAIRAMSQTLSTLGGTTDAYAVLVSEANEEVSRSWRESKKQVDDFFGSSQKAFAAFREEMRENAQQQADFAINIAKISAVLGEDVARNISEMGEHSAAVAATVVENLGEAGTDSMESLANEIKAGSPAAQDALSAAMLGLSKISDEQGEDIGTALTDAFGRSIDRELAPGGSADVMKIYDQVQTLTALIEANPPIAEILIDETGANATIEEMVRRAEILSQQNALGPTGFAELQEEEFLREMQGLEVNVSGASESGEFDPNGTAYMDSRGFLKDTELLALNIKRRSAQGAWDPQATPNLLGDPFRDRLRQLSTVTEVTGERWSRDLRVRPSLELERYNSQRRAMLTNARLTGDAIQRALTRQASVTVSTYIRPGARLGDQRALADGGWVTGRGGPRQDNIPVMASSGEFVVNARAASRYGALLEQLNSFSGSGGAPVDTGLVSPLRQTSGDTMRPAVATPERMRMTAQEPQGQARMIINVHNVYPRSEPTSVTVNRSLAYAAALDGV